MQMHADNYCWMGWFAVGDGNHDLSGATHTFVSISIGNHMNSNSILE